MAGFEQMKAWVGLTSVAQERLRKVGPSLYPHLQQVVDRFYNAILQDPEAKAVFRDENQLKHTSEMLHAWLVGLFGGVYGEAYFKQRSQIGEAHVRVDLPQRFVFTAMGVVRQELSRHIRALNLQDEEQTSDALHTLLDLELGIMLETYRESYIDKVRKADRIIMRRELEGVQHMATIGQLAASLAHEIKNPLAGISGAVQIIFKEMEESNPHRQIIHEILRQIDRLDAAVIDLLIYARPKPPALQLADMGEVVRNCLSVLKGDPLLRAISISCEGTDQQVEAMIDPGQIDQVISNLVLNAAQACDGNGEIRVKLASNDQELVLSVKDNGVGMPEETRERALEPFFTTKTKGTGLGLPICDRIIQAHHGNLRIESTPNVGTLIEVHIPRSPQSTEEKASVT